MAPRPNTLKASDPRSQSNLTSQACYNQVAKRYARLMRFPRRILLLMGASFFVAILLPAAGAAGAQLTPSRTRAAADNWTDPAAELATKILSHIAPPLTATVSQRNFSSLGEDEASQIRRALRSELRHRGLLLTGSKQAAIEIQVTLSENVEGYVWVAEIRNGSSRDVAMITVARPEAGPPRSVAEPLSIRKIRIYEQSEPMLDFAVLENSVPAPTGTPRAARALVLSLHAVSLYEKDEEARKNSSGWQKRESAPVLRLRSWPRDPRGRLIIGRENSFSVNLPGAKCNGTLEPALKLDCHESDDPWPLVDGSLPGAAAYFAADRNFFDGRIRFEDGHELKLAPFFSAGYVRSKGGAMWLLAGLDDRAQLLGLGAESLAKIGGWGSAIISLQTACQSGGQVLANRAGDSSQADAVLAYEIVNRKAEAASAPVEFSGPVTELWPVADGSAAIAISHNLKTGTYEAFRLSISCGQ